MGPDAARRTLANAKAAQSEIDELWKPPEEGSVPKSEFVLLRSVVKGTRPYIENIVHQINGTYEHGWYDACAVMIRRLIETLIIEVYEYHGIADQIQDASGHFFFLSGLIPKVVGEKGKWNIGRNVERALPRLKDIGDTSAHTRYYLAHRGDIEKVIPDLRIVAQALILIARLK